MRLNLQRSEGRLVFRVQYLQVTCWRRGHTRGMIRSVKGMRMAGLRLEMDAAKLI